MMKFETQQRPDNDRRPFAAMAVLGAVLLVYGSLVPFHFHQISFADAVSKFQSLFATVPMRWGETADWSLNLTVMLPIAFFGMGAILDGRRSKWLAVLAIPVVVLGCVCLSMFVEFSQLWCESRVASSRDVLAQALGAFVGIAVWLAAGPRFSSWRRSFAALREPQHKFIWILQAYVLGLLIYSVVPVDIAMSPAELAEKYRAGMIELVPFTYDRGGLLKMLYGVLTDILLFVPVGMCVVVAWNPRGRKLRPTSQALLAGAAIAIGIEVVQLFIVGRFSSSADVILGFAGAALGIALIHIWRKDGQNAVPAETAGSHVAALCLLGALIYAGLLALIFWAPFDLTSNTELVKNRLHAFIEIPFVQMHEGSDLQGIFSAIRKVLWFSPLGILLAMAAIRVPARSTYRSGLLATAALAIIVVALAIELGRVFLPDKVADSTDVILSASGGIVGLVATIAVLSKKVPSSTRLAKQQPSTIPPTRPHLRGLDGLRALACLAVFGVHFQQATGISGQWGVFDLQRMLENGNTGVALFFTLSGFLLALPLWSRSPSTRAIQLLEGYGGKRLVRILPAYMLCLTVLVLVKRHWRNPADVQDTVLHYLFLQNYSPHSFYSISSPFWTVAVQMQFYLAFGFLIWILHRLQWTSDKLLLIVFALACGGSYMLHCIVMESASPIQVERWGPVLSRSVLAHFPLFFLGVLSAYVFVRHRDSTIPQSQRGGLVRDLAFAVSAMALFLILSTPLDDWFQVPFGRYNLPYAPLLLAIVIVNTPGSRFALRFLELAPIRTLGVISYGFFIYHLACMNVVSRAFEAAGEPPKANLLLFAGASLLLTLAIASGSYFFVERPLLSRNAKQSRTR